MRLSSLLLDALFPDACLGCLAPKEHSWRHEIACDACIDALPIPTRFSCSACGNATLGLIPPCHPEEASLLAAGSPASRLLGALSAGLLYEGMERAAPVLAELVAAASISCGLPLHRAIVIPRPESSYASRGRGYPAHELVAREFATSLRLPLETRPLTASALGGGTVLGIGQVGDAAAAEHLVVAGVTLPDDGARARIGELARAACPHATLTFVAATS